MPAGIVEHVNARTTPDPHSALLLVAGASLLAWTGILVALAGADPATASVWRCVLALVVLGPWALAEYRRAGGLPPATVGWSRSPPIR